MKKIMQMQEIYGLFLFWKGANQEQQAQNQLYCLGRIHKHTSREEAERHLELLKAYDAWKGKADCYEWRLLEGKQPALRPK